MAEHEEPLLKPFYYDGCPGCEIDQWKDNNHRIPYRYLAHIWFITLCGALPISSMFPFLYFMIRDLHVAKRVEDIGFYAGFVGSSFMFGRALTSVFWGIIADRYGRKPVIIIGIVVVVIFNALFGLSTSYFMAIATRFLLGSLNGLLGPIKAYAVEVCRPEYQAIGISLVSTAWGMGLVVGPSIGGLLAQPADKYPNLFSKDSFFGRFPYSLPCLFISLIATVVLSTCYWLPETLHKHDQNKPATVITAGLEGSFHGTEVKVDLKELEGNDPDSDINTNKSLLMNWPLMSSVIVYCVFSLHDMAYTEIFPLWAESGRAYGGLGFSSQEVGEVLAISGFSLLIFQFFVYPPMEKLLGYVNLCRAAAVLAIPLTAAYPFMTKLSGSELTIIVNCASLMKNVFSVAIVTGMFILQNNAVPQCQRGAANGISMTGQSIFKAIAPAAGGVMYGSVLKTPITRKEDLQHTFSFLLSCGWSQTPNKIYCSSTPGRENLKYVFIVNLGPVKVGPVRFIGGNSNTTILPCLSSPPLFAWKH